jgi:hypothetical protein
MQRAPNRMGTVRDVFTFFLAETGIARLPKVLKA